MKGRMSLLYKMFPYIVTFQNKLKGVIIQYIRKVLGIIFLQFIIPIFVLCIFAWKFIVIRGKELHAS